MDGLDGTASWRLEEEGRTESPAPCCCVRLHGRGLLKIKKQLLKEPRITEMERLADTSVGVEAPHFDVHIILDHNTREDGNFHIPIIEYGDKKRLC
ncbi:hypothetical protein OROGR_009339 [Orobanche gracilis]